MRKSPAARVEVAKPETVAERRRALRGEDGAVGPGVKKVLIDLTTPGARKALTALYPAPENEVFIDATPELERAAHAYVVERDAAKVASVKQQIAGNILCNAIAKNKGIRGVGWRAEWDTSKGNIDWAELAKEECISDETIAKYRKPPSRGLDVTEVADEG